ncbi:MAG: hypothetical protein HOP16_08860 [Acidobacteria bacterium]|nr:hypothetical protein [Acidobacteriota bacterium]
MPSRLRIAALGLMLIAYPLVGAAQVPQSYLGNWKMNVAQSKSTTPLNRSNTVRVEAAPGGAAKFTIDTVDATGKATHDEYVTAFDGKAVDVKSAAAPTTRTYTRIDDRTYQYVTRVNGKVTTTTRTTMAADGKTRTQVSTGTGADGKPVNTTTVYDRQ